MMHVKIDHGLQFRIEATVGEYHVDFVIREIAAWYCDTNTPAYIRAGATSGMDTTDDPAQAQVFAHGSVKWDGCSDWHIDAQDDCMLHGCTREDLTRIGEILARCRDWTAELLPTWNSEVAD